MTLRPQDVNACAHPARGCETCAGMCLAPGAAGATDAPESEVFPPRITGTLIPILNLMQPPGLHELDLAGTEFLDEDIDDLTETSHVDERNFRHV